MRRILGFIGVLGLAGAGCGIFGGSDGGGDDRGGSPDMAQAVVPRLSLSIRLEDKRNFNALFVPMQARGGIVQFELGSSELDPGAKTLIEQVFADRGGASYFFIVARASQDGATEYNRKLSEQRARSVMGHLHTVFADASLDDQVGLLWLGEEYAQLDPSFCAWSRNGVAGRCRPDELNRSAFLAWIECRL